MLFNGLLVACGVLLIGSGIWFAFTNEPPMDTVGAFLASVGIVTVIVGVLLICVPGFFTS